MKGINKRIEELRKQLNELVDGIDSCGEEKILEVSQELDKVIYEYIKKKLKYWPTEHIKKNTENRIASNAYFL